MLDALLGEIELSHRGLVKFNISVVRNLFTNRNQDSQNVFAKRLRKKYSVRDLSFGDGADDFVGSFVAFGTGAAGRRERTNKIVSTIAKSQMLQLSNQRNSDLLKPQN